MIRKILVPVRGDGEGDNVLAHAAALAHLHKAHILVTHCRPRPQDMIPYGVPIPEFLRDQIAKQSGQVADLEEQGLRDELKALAVQLKLDPSDHPTGKSATVSFVAEPGRQVEIIKRHGRLADLIAVAQPDLDRNLGTNTLKAALFHSGRPVLMCPKRDEAPRKLGENLAIAWNGSAEAARAIAQSMDVIRAASTVNVLTNGVDAGNGTSIDDVVEYLSLHGVKADVTRFDFNKKAARAIMAASAEIGADLIVMGAYSESHERQTMFGGNTQVCVDSSTMPILFSH
ncbi:MAG: universal stress protein [Halocynthiibacter sp.]